MSWKVLYSRSIVPILCQGSGRSHPEVQPEIVLYGATDTRSRFCWYSATTLEAGLTADCTGLDIDPETQIFETDPTRLCGNIMATIQDYPKLQALKCQRCGQSVRHASEG